eukprot:COSAG02_NODE_466_length_21773_cov_71.190966_8_plen_196_part_00
MHFLGSRNNKPFSHPPRYRYSILVQVELEATLVAPAYLTRAVERSTDPRYGPVDRVSRFWPIGIALVNASTWCNGRSAPICSLHGNQLPQLAVVNMRRASTRAWALRRSNGGGLCIGQGYAGRNSPHAPPPTHNDWGSPAAANLGAHYLTVYSTVKGTLRIPSALPVPLRRSGEVDLFFIGLTTVHTRVIMDHYS